MQYGFTWQAAGLRVQAATKNVVKSAVSGLGE
jgi:hypothetical protein